METTSMNLRNLTKGILLIVAIVSALSVSAQPSLTFSTAKRGPVMSDLHYGIFYEEINHGGDGGRRGGSGRL